MVGEGAGPAYHGWTYGLDGSLRAVPHRDGFPDIELAERGLAEMPAEERHGLVFVTQDGTRSPSSAVDRSTVITYVLSTATGAQSPDTGSVSEPEATAAALLRSGAQEDFGAARSVQCGLASGANTHLEFGLYEAGISNFHDQLDRHLSS